MTPLIAFLLAAAVLAITPGPGIAYVVARTVAGGRAEGMASCFGTALGGMVHVMAAAFGLSAILAQSSLAFAVLKYAGAAYLVYLGVRLLLRRQQVSTPTVVRSAGASQAFRDGVFVEALNVKTAVFFLAFLPQFVSVEEPLVPQLVMMGTICVFLNTLADVIAVSAASRFLRSPAARAAREKWLTKVSGFTMIGLGVYLAAAKRAT